LLREGAPSLDEYRFSRHPSGKVGSATGGKLLTFTAWDAEARRFTRIGIFVARGAPSLDE
jgi:hypothetical protein